MNSILELTRRYEDPGGAIMTLLSTSVAAARRREERALAFSDALSDIDDRITNVYHFRRSERARLQAIARQIARILGKL